MPEYSHIPVLMQEVLAALGVRPGGHYADGTLGGCGHAAAILAASAPNGRLFGCDRDGFAIEAAKERLAVFAGRWEIHRGNFAEVASLVSAGSLDGMLLDLGVSSHQLDEAARGFSFQQDGPLDMRMDQRQELTAASVVNEFEVEELAGIFWELGDEPQSRRFARAIETDRKVRPFTTTKQLAELIERLSPRHGRRAHPATQVFQALRVYVNDELGSLRKGLEAGVQVLKSGGKLVVITFQSHEARMVKDFGREMTRDYEFDGPVDDPNLRRPKQAVMRWLERKAVTAGRDELEENPRSRSAQLRVLEKI